MSWHSSGKIKTQTKTQKILLLVVVLAALIGCITIISTYNHVSPTSDEAAHVATGMEWLEKGTYQFEYLHPPLARIAIALPLYLRGVRMAPEILQLQCPPFLFFVQLFKESQRLPRMQQTTPRCLGMADFSLLLRNPDRSMSVADLTANMILVRVPILLFYVMSIIGIYLYGALLHSQAVGAIGASLFALSPTVMAHAGVATTDMAFAGAFIFVNYIFLLWIRNRNTATMIACMIALGIGLLTKISAIIFFPICFIVTIGYMLYRRDITWHELVSQAFLVQSVKIIVGAGFIIWGAYRFSVGAISHIFYGAEPWVSALPAGTLQDMLQVLIHSQIVPFPEFFNGILDAIYKNERGHASYILGKQLLHQGVWYFFPVAIWMKSTFPFIVATIAGGGLIVYATVKKPAHTWLLVPLLCTSLILAMLMNSDINIGVRHVLHIYSFMALFAGYTIYKLWQSSYMLCKGAAVTIMVFHLASTAMAYPNYLAYFNITAGKNPENILVDSDLDWGQDAKHLAIKLQELGIKHITICSSMIVRIYIEEQLGEENIDDNCPDMPVKGWFVTSFSEIKFNKAEELKWLENMPVKYKIGDSIMLYYNG